MHEAANFGMIGLIPPGAAASLRNGRAGRSRRGCPARRALGSGRFEREDAEKQAPANAFGGYTGD